MSEPGPIHPALAPLARAAKAFGKMLRATNVAPGGLAEALGGAVARDRSWLRPEHRVGELAELDLGGPLYHRVSNHGVRPVLSLHLYGVASGLLTTGINRIYAEE